MVTMHPVVDILQIYSYKECFRGEKNPIHASLSLSGFSTGSPSVYWIFKSRKKKSYVEPPLIGKHSTFRRRTFKGFERLNVSNSVAYIQYVHTLEGWGEVFGEEIEDLPTPRLLENTFFNGFFV